MKRVFFAVFMLCVLSAALFAGESNSWIASLGDMKQQASAMATPYAVQISTGTGAKAVASTYGLGIEASYRIYPVENIFVEGEFGWNYFLYKNKEYKSFNDIMLSCVGGYDFAINEDITVDAHAGIADDILIYAGKVSNTFTLKTGVGGTYKLTDDLSAVAKLDVSFGFAKKDGTNYVNYKVVPMAGCSYSF